jgi:hypothetical protein
MTLIKRIALVLTLDLAPLAAEAGLQTAPSPPAAVTLQWDSSTDPTITNYNVYIGTSSGDYTQVIAAGNTNQITIPIMRGVTYYFAATDVADTGLESLFSNEISYTAPGRPAPPVIRFALLPDGTVMLTLRGTPYDTCLVEGSEDNVHWQTIGQVIPNISGVATFVDQTASCSPRPFYFYRLAC